MPFKFGKLAGGFLALAALTAAGAPVKVPVPAENNGKVPGWTIRADGKTDVSGVAGGFRFHSPEKTVMVVRFGKVSRRGFHQSDDPREFQGNGNNPAGISCLRQERLHLHVSGQKAET